MRQAAIGNVGDLGMVRRLTARPDVYAPSYSHCALVAGASDAPHGTMAAIARIAPARRKWLAFVPHRRPPGRRSTSTEIAVPMSYSNHSRAPVVSFSRRHSYAIGLARPPPQTGLVHGARRSFASTGIERARCVGVPIPGATLCGARPLLLEPRRSAENGNVLFRGTLNGAVRQAPEIAWFLRLEPGATS
jgi:hypothetical protein